jgi:hypothetical protein
MPAAEPPTPAAPTAIALALARIEALRAEGFELIEPESCELARLRRGREIISVPVNPQTKECHE